MLPDVELSFHPNIINCLAWSDDGELAIAAGEFVHILIPRRRQLEAKQFSDPWEHVHFRVNTFTFEEWPLQDPAGFEGFSIGEEQSNCVVSALHWSPLGLGKHRRSILAVQTSNLLLSFWQSASNPFKNASWQRIFVVNNAIKKSWERRFLSGNPLTENSLCRKVRIRGTVWAPEAVQNPEDHNPQLEARKGVFLLAVANDDDEILILLISSPYIDHFSSWDAKIVKVIRFSDISPQLESGEAQAGDGFENRGSEVVHMVENRGVNGNFSKSPPSLLKIAFESKHFIDNISWGPLSLLKNGATVLSFIRSGAVFHCVLYLSFPFPTNSSLSNVPRFYLECTGGCKNSNINRFGGFATWYSHSSNDESLVVVSDRGQLNISSWNSSSSEILTHKQGFCQIRPHVDRFGCSEAKALSLASQSWDQISGLAFHGDREDQSVYLYFSTQLSHIETVRVMDYIQESGKSRLCWEHVSQPQLYKCMLQVQERFDVQNELGGLSIMKTWGLVSFDNYVAACITLHPGDMAEYCIPSQERATIVFSTHRADDSSSKSESFSWEAYSIIKDSAKSQSEIINTVLEYERQNKYELTELSNKIIYAVAIAASLIWDDERPQRLVAAEHALQRLERSAKIELTLELEALRLLQTRDLRIDEGIAAIKNATESRNSEEHWLRSTQRLLDICPFCSKTIAWENLTEAWCEGGHQFVRCNLTFLAIKTPGISKNCERCSRQFLNEHILSPARITTTMTANGDGASSLPSIEELVDMDIFDDNLHRINGKGTPLNLDAIRTKSQSLAAILFDTYDVCPYCGGKFIG